MIRLMVRAGLLIVAVTVAVLIFTDDAAVGGHRDLVKIALRIGAALTGAGLLLGVLAKVVNTSWGRRCPRCRRPVARGHVYCEDHFQEALLNARDHYRTR